MSGFLDNIGADLEEWENLGHAQHALYAEALQLVQQQQQGSSNNSNDAARLREIFRNNTDH